MKPEFVSRKQIGSRWVIYRDLNWGVDGELPYQVTAIKEAFHAGARAVLEELKIINIYEIAPLSRCPFKDEQWCKLLENMCGFACKAECACPFRKGIVLVRAKEKAICADNATG